MTDILTGPPDTDFFRINDLNRSVEVVRIDKDGRIFWHGREVETDDDFRAAMMEVAQFLRDNVRLTRGPTA